MLLSDEIMLNV